MTGVTLELRPWQIDELRRYSGGELVEGDASKNLIRRGFLIRMQGGHKITTLGRMALERSAEPS